MSEITERLIARANELGLKQADLMKGTGAGKSTVHKWFNNLNDPSAKYLDDVAKTLKVSTNWLLTGKEETLDNAQLPIDIIDPRGFANVESIPQKIRKAPVLNWVQAGKFNDVFEDTYDEYEYFYDDGYGLQVFWLKIKGDSMEPQFFEGDKILVDSDKQPRAGSFVIAKIDGDEQATFKKFKPCGFDEKLGKEYWQLVPLNDFYPTYDSRFVPINITGVVVKHERKLG